MAGKVFYDEYSRDLRESIEVETYGSVAKMK